MKTKEFNIGSTPALLIGEKSDRVFLYVHGAGKVKDVYS